MKNIKLFAAILLVMSLLCTCFAASAQTVTDNAVFQFELPGDWTDTSTGIDGQYGYTSAAGALVVQSMDMAAMGLTTDMVEAIGGVDALYDMMITTLSTQYDQFTPVGAVDVNGYRCYRIDGEQSGMAMQLLVAYNGVDTLLVCAFVPLGNEVDADTIFNTLTFIK